jgi:hypothetical protein
MHVGASGTSRHVGRESPTSPGLGATANHLIHDVAPDRTDMTD